MKISASDRRLIFHLLDEGNCVIDIITSRGLDPEIVEEAFQVWVEQGRMNCLIS
jgi:hypothetical protein